MKKNLIAIYSIAFFSLLSLAARSQYVPVKPYDFVKERTVSKSYTAKGNDLNIDNKFGKIKIITWNRDEIKVDVHIMTSSTNEANAGQILNAINPVDTQSGNVVKFVTTIGSVRDCKGCKSNMTIDYEIHLPANIPLTLKNSFGLIELPAYSGVLSLQSNHGDVTTGSLSAVKNFSVFNGLAHIEKLKNSNCVFNGVDVQIDGLADKNILLFNNCTANLVVNTVTTELDIRGVYTTLQLHPSKSLTAEYFIESRYGTFKNTSNNTFYPVDEDSKKGDGHTTKYHTKNGNGNKNDNGAPKVLITSSYGDILIGEGSVPKSGQSAGPS